MFEHYFEHYCLQAEGDLSDEVSRIANLAVDVSWVKTSCLVMQELGPSNRCRGVCKF